MLECCIMLMNLSTEDCGHIYIIQLFRAINLPVKLLFKFDLTNYTYFMGFIWFQQSTNIWLGECSHIRLDKLTSVSSHTLL